jgi:enterobactin synthetase component F
MRAELARPMDLGAGDVVRAVLLSLPRGRTWWFHAAHYVVLDGYGAQQLLRRVCELYDGAAPAGSAVTLAEVVADDLLRADDEGAAAFWDARLGDMTGAASLAGRAAAPAPAAIKRSLELSPETQALLVQSARRQRVGWPDLFAAAVGGYVARMAGSASARIGVPLMNRTVSGVGALPSAQTVCTAMNVLPVTVPADGTVAEALAATTAEQAAVRAHPFARQEALARRLAQLTGGQLFGAQVNVVPFELELRLGAATGVVRNLTAGPVEDMTVCLRGTPGRRRVVRLEIDANPELYAVDEVELHLARLTEWLAAYAGADPEAPVREVPLLPDAERELVTLAFNDTAVERRPDTLGARFAAQAARTPEATALVFRGETRTYAQLLDAARRLAAGLASRGVRPGDVVGVALERGFALYEAVHALALLGAVYLPVDPDLPAARVDGMLEDAGLLTAAERERRDRLHRADDRAAFVAAHVLVRECAARLLGVEVGEVEIAQRCAGCGGPHGRPTVAGVPDVHVSLSHSRGVVAAAAAWSPCGIDVEPLRPIAPIAAVLTEAERAWIADQTDPSAAFLRLWVRKEALVKAGFGSLNDPLSLDALTPPVPVTDWTDGRAVGAFAHAAS